MSVLNIFLKVMKHPSEQSRMWRDVCGKKDLENFFSSSQSSPTSDFKGAEQNAYLRQALPSPAGLVSIPWFFWKCPLSIRYPWVTPRWEWWLWSIHPSPYMSFPLNKCIQSGIIHPPGRLLGGKEDSRAFRDSLWHPNTFRLIHWGRGHNQSGPCGAFHIEKSGSYTCLIFQFSGVLLEQIDTHSWTFWERRLILREIPVSTHKEEQKHCPRHHIIW